jgi:cytochrome c556
MKPSRLPMLLAALLVAITAAPSIAQQSPKPEQLVKWRQSAYQVLAWNNARIKSSLEEASYNRDEVQRAANVIAALANGNLGSLFAPGTEKAKGWRETAARPELFTEPRVAQLAADFSREATGLAQTAASGDPAAVRESFNKLGRTCKACHDAYRVKD